MPDFTTSAIQRFTKLEPHPQPPLIRLRHPVLLMHGFGLLASVRRGGHMHEVAMALRKNGVWAFAPNVAPYNTVAVRAQMWEDRIAQMLDETGASHFSIIAHSMGGLDARFLIQTTDLHEQIEALVTVATPHRGTSIANLALEQPDRVREWMANVFDWIGSKAMRDSPSNTLDSVRELTPDYVQNTFNEAVPDHPDVRYWSYAGRAGKGTDVPLDPFFYMLNTYLYSREGVNDGYVSVDSATWGTFCGTIGADHARQVGIDSSLGAAFDAPAFYRGVVRMLAEEGL